MVVVLTFVLIPTDLLWSKFLTLIGRADTSAYGQMAEGNIGFKREMYSLSLQVISTHPLGDACIPEPTFRERGLFPVHSLQMFLHQFRERGWVWGLLHLGIWVLAGLLPWRSRTPVSSFALGAWSTAVTVVLFDHPWFVLKQALFLGVILLRAFVSSDDRPRNRWCRRHMGIRRLKCLWHL